MSFDWNLPPYRSFHQKDELLAEYAKNLEIKAKLNKEYAVANAQRVWTLDSGIGTSPMPVRTQAEIEDYARYQRDILTTQLLKIMLPKEVELVMSSFDVNSGDADRKIKFINDNWAVIYNDMDKMNKDYLRDDEFLYYVDLVQQATTHKGANLDPTNSDDQYILAGIWAKFMDHFNLIDQPNPPTPDDGGKKIDDGGDTPSGAGMRRKSKRVKVGSGVAINDSPRYLEFGKYCVHVDSLKKHVLNVKYPKTFSTVQLIPRQIISKPLSDMIFEVCHSQKFNHPMFDQLNNKDQKLFKQLALKSRFDDKIGVSTNDTDENDKVERFELLRGSIISGNNDPNALRELKSLILHFMATGKLKRSDGNELLAELSIIV
jgi:hypothetical protein